MQASRGNSEPRLGRPAGFLRRQEPAAHFFCSGYGNVPFPDGRCRLAERLAVCGTKGGEWSVSSSGGHCAAASTRKKRKRGDCLAPTLRANRTASPGEGSDLPNLLG